MINEIYKGSNNIKLSFSVSNQNGVLDLSGATVTLILSKNGVDVEKAVTIDDAQAGECSYLLQSTDIEETGRYLQQLEIDYGNGNLYYGQIQGFDVIEKL